MSHKILSLKQEIETKEELWNYLRIAMEVELSTIPTYLSAIYSLKPDTNQAARDVMYSVVIEEMLHLTLAGNVLRATGGLSELNSAEFVPKYPTPLPDSNIDLDGKTFEVPLQKFGIPALDVFLRIEKPERPGSKPAVKGWHSIGQFYDGLTVGLDNLCKQLGTGEVFNGEVGDQIQPEDYYGGSGEVIVVANENPDIAHENSKRAFKEIVDQGEGLHHKVMDGDEVPGKGGQGIPVPAHYFRFDEIKREQYYKAGDKPGCPTGPQLNVDWDAVHDMQKNPMMSKYEEGSEIHEALLDFNRTYMALLNILNDAFNKDQSLLMKATGMMYDLKYKAVALMKIPSGEGDTTVGPSFEYIAPGT